MLVVGGYNDHPAHIRIKKNLQSRGDEEQKDHHDRGQVKAELKKEEGKEDEKEGKLIYEDPTFSSINSKWAFLSVQYFKWPT